MSATSLWSVPLSNFNYVQKYTSGRECVLSTCHKELPKRSPEPGRSAAPPPAPHARVIAKVLFLRCTNMTRLNAAPHRTLARLLRTCFTPHERPWLPTGGTSRDGGIGGGGRGALDLSCGRRWRLLAWPCLRLRGGRPQSGVCWWP